MGGPGWGPGAGRDRRTGRVLSPFAGGYVAARIMDGGWTWRGGVRIATMHADAPLARLDLIPPRLDVRIGLSRRLSVPTVRVAPGWGVWCYPVVGRMGASRGIAIERPTASTCYFFSAHADEILTAVQWAGFAVSWEEQFVRSMFGG